MTDLVERKIGDLIVRIDRKTCIGSANCIKVAPGLFGLDSENVVAFKPDAAPVERDQVIEACQVCPVDALTVLDAAGNQLVP